MPWALKTTRSTPTGFLGSNQESSHVWDAANYGARNSFRSLHYNKQTGMGALESITAQFSEERTRYRCLLEIKLDS